jgi:hypothetical protein
MRWDPRAKMAFNGASIGFRKAGEVLPQFLLMELQTQLAKEIGRGIGKPRQSLRMNIELSHE